MTLRASVNRALDLRGDSQQDLGSSHSVEAVYLHHHAVVETDPAGVGGKVQEAP